MKCSRHRTEHQRRDRAGSAIDDTAHPARRAAQPARPEGRALRLRRRPVRDLRGDRRRRGRRRVPARGRQPRGQARSPRWKGIGTRRAAASAADRVHGAAGRPVRLLPRRHPGRAPRRCSTATRTPAARRSPRRWPGTSAAAARTTASWPPWRWPPSGCAPRPGRRHEHPRQPRRQSAPRPLGRVRDARPRRASPSARSSTGRAR